MANPRWLLGRHLTAISCQAMTEDTAGTLTTVTTAVPLGGWIDSVAFASRPIQSLIQSVDRNQAHYETEIEDFSLVLAEILTVKAAHTPVLPTMAASYDFYTVAFTRGGQTFTLRMRRGQYTDGVTNFGKNVAILAMVPVDNTGNLVGPGFATSSAVTFTP